MWQNYDVTGWLTGVVAVTAQLHHSYCERRFIEQHRYLRGTLTVVWRGLILFPFWQLMQLMVCAAALAPTACFCSVFCYSADILPTRKLFSPRNVPIKAYLVQHYFVCLFMNYFHHWRQQVLLRESQEFFLGGSQSHEITSEPNLKTANKTGWHWPGQWSETSWEIMSQKAVCRRNIVTAAFPTVQKWLHLERSI